MTAFSNGSEWEIWSHNWCNQCKKDDWPDKSCSILEGVMIDNIIPVEFTVLSLGDYACKEFEHRVD
jgi:hypothetical protein